MPAISVIIPNYNHAAYLRQRIDSVLEQTCQDFELIILDDASSDNSREIIESYRGNPRITHIVYNARNSGNTFRQWQKGISLAVGYYLWIAESDDWADRAFLSEMLATIEHNKNLGMTFCNSNWIDAGGNVKDSLSLDNTSFVRNGKDEIRSRLLRFNTIQNASSALMKTSLVKELFGRATSYKSCGDWYLYIRLLSKSDIAFCEKKLNNFRWYTSNVSNAAQSKGLWIKEGISILRDSKNILAGLSQNELTELFNYWLEQVKGLTGPQSFYWKWKLQFTFSQVAGKQRKNLVEQHA
jgi:glycosyltransferase involved in cell wall biosynthesis